MKSRFKNLGFGDLCSWFGISRQAYYQFRQEADIEAIEHELVIKEILKIRTSHPRMGGRKLFFKVSPFMKEHQIKMGRDAFFNLLSFNRLLVKKKKNYIKTTYSNHWLRKYPNLISEIVPTAPNQIWASDITYWKINGEHLYISLITDTFSRKIVGYHVAETMEAVETLQALKMAIRNNKGKLENLIHHSDRGVQYCSTRYVKLLKKNKINISMTQNGDPLENAIAERINGIIKHEYLFEFKADNLEQAKKLLHKVVRLYNEERSHSSIGFKTPFVVHERLETADIDRVWKNYYEKHEVLV